ncbi:hypothetical protein DB35_04960 [Streptomyces abyssalis]|uniref:SpdD-like protein n=1 Tax=Streptomyces abyssalis TaxID=933944 RepID=A0A1E7JQL9_9ACTN|nr:hypothetical protein [Streptomyces abyssalis]OEU90535.1 hypothetical protein AN215_14035 [Streptomyces abyssalis]OEU95274.1 hypothetical protein DB35_04960 [Streptomyces abyssalis]
MTEHTNSQTSQAYVLTDASGRQFASLAPAAQPPAEHAVAVGPHTNAAPSCCSHHDHGQQAPARRQFKPSAVGVGTAGALAVGVVLVSLLLSVAVVAIAVGISAVAITCCVLVMRSLTTYR